MSEREDILDLHNEVTADGRLKREVRASILDGYRRGIYTATQCFDFYDTDKLWPARKEDFWQIFYSGLIYSDQFSGSDTIRQTAAEATGSHLNISIPDLAERTLGRSTPPYMATQNDFERHFDAEVAS